MARKPLERRFFCKRQSSALVFDSQYGNKLLSSSFSYLRHKNKGEMLFPAVTKLICMGSAEKMHVNLTKKNLLIFFS